MPAPYALDFKRKAVHAANNRGDKTFAEVAEKFGISPVTLGSWRASLGGEVETAGGELPKPNGHAQGPGPRLPEEPAKPNGKGPSLAEVNELHERAAQYAVDELARLRAENAELRSLLKKLL